MHRETFTIDQLTNTYIFLRHGATDWNDQRIYMGQQDIHLNQSGIQAAHKVIFPIKPDLCYTSPLSRTQETTEIVVRNNDLSIPIVDNRLIEKNGGITEGMSHQAIKEMFPEIWNLWHIANVDDILQKSRFEGGESDWDVYIRLHCLLSELEQNITNKLILLVSHSGVDRMMRLLCNYPQDEVYPGAKLHNCQWEVF